MPLIVSAAEIMDGVPGHLRSDPEPHRVPANEHGTTRGFNKHKRDGTKACRPCLDAESARKRDLRARGAGPAVQEHGTVRGFNQHRGRHEKPCNQCRYAEARREMGRS